MSSVHSLGDDSGVRDALARLSRDDSKPIAVAVALGILLAVLGFLVVPEGLVGNLISEAAGLAFGVVVALVLVERVLERQRAREWHAVGGRTTRALKRRIRDISVNYHLEGPDIPLDDERFVTHMMLDQPEQEIAKSIRALSDAMRATHPRESAGRPDPELEVGEEPHIAPQDLHAAVASDFDYIKTVLTPRVITLSSDPTLAELLLRLEDHEEDWRGWMQTGKDWGAPDTLAWEEATAAVEVAAAIYEHLAEPRPTAETREDAESAWRDLPH